MVTITFEQIKEHDKKGDMKEWINGIVQEDRERRVVEGLRQSATQDKTNKGAKE